MTTQNASTNTLLQKATHPIELTQKMVNEGLHNMDDGELFVEYTQSEQLLFDDGTIKNTNFDIEQGFGFRTVIGETSAYAYGNDFDEHALARAIQTARQIKNGHNGTARTATPSKEAVKLYANINPIDSFSLQDKLKILENIDSYVRGKSSNVKQVTISLAGSLQAVDIFRIEQHLSDSRPLVRLNITVLLEHNGRTERGTYGSGGRFAYDSILNESHWQHSADEAIRQAEINLEATPSPAGEMPVVLGGGWPGILLHEAIGHGLEGDFNRKKISAFSDLMGQQIAANNVTVVDDGTIKDRRGSLTIDDEGTPSQNTVLIENGILKSYMFDRLNARLMGTDSTGNGRRESYAYQPMPRMTNTYMLNGKHSFDEMIASVPDGIYAANFGGGQVDITSGKFVFSASEAYRIENGKITHPVKGVTLIGNGPDVLTKIKMVGNDMQLDPGIGTCGKDGQGVPVGVGQPSLLIEGLTVGGTGE